MPLSIRSIDKRKQITLPMEQSLHLPYFSASENVMAQIRMFARAFRPKTTATSTSRS